MTCQIKNQLFTIRKDFLNKNSHKLDASELDRMVNLSMRNKIASLNLFEKTNTQVESDHNEKSYRASLTEGGVRELEIKSLNGSKNLVTSLYSKENPSSKCTNNSGLREDMLGSDLLEAHSKKSDPSYLIKKPEKKVHFELTQLEESHYESCEGYLTETDDNEEVWFNNDERTGVLYDFFKEEDNILELIITVYAMIKYFNGSYFIQVLGMLTFDEQVIFETKINKISNELSKQVTNNKNDKTMAESNYLLVIQQDLENTQIRLVETEKLMKQQQADYADLEIKTNNLLRVYENSQKELAVYCKINDMLQDEMENTSNKFNEIK